MYMNTKKSEKIVQAFLQKKTKFERRIQKFSSTLESTPEEIFPLLCPTREADWVDGWKCELLYTGSGYAEDKAIFRTDENSHSGKSLWMVTRYEPNEIVDLIRFMGNDVLQHIHIEVKDNKNGSTTIMWESTFTALSEKGNRIVKEQVEPHVPREAHGKTITEYLLNPDTTRSETLVRDFKQKEPKLLRKKVEFLGTWEAQREDIFPLLCPAREADWIMGWDCEIIYSSTGYAEDKCVFKTEPSNPHGGGLWTFTRYEKNEFLDFIRVLENILLHVRITLKDNNNGTVTATWEVTPTALNEEGNKEVDGLVNGIEKGVEVLHLMIDHYLKKGEMIPKTSLFLKAAHGNIKGHLKK